METFINENMILNPDTTKVEKIRQALIRTEGYCPCLIKRNEDTICPCKKMRENNECICGLYVNK